MTKSKNSTVARNVARAAGPAQIFDCRCLDAASPGDDCSLPRQKQNEAAAPNPKSKIQNPKFLLAAPFLLLIKIYQWTLSPLLHALAGPNAGCRFHPSCSRYAADALRAHGLPRGAALAVWRLLRCNPFNHGGHDPVPPPARPRCGHIA